MFVNAADEKQGAIWKACFRAGEAVHGGGVEAGEGVAAEL